jgi:hypothetical protein
MGRVVYDANSEFAPLLRRMQTPSTLNNGTKTHYGMGLFHESWSGQEMISHGGAWVGFRAELVRLPEQHFSVITLCNLANTNPMVTAKKVVALYYLAAPRMAATFGPNGFTLDYGRVRGLHCTRVN